MQPVCSAVTVRPPFQQMTTMNGCIDDEFERLRALDATRVLDSLPDPLYDDCAKLASMLCATPIALVSLIDRDRQWFKAREGLDATQTPRDQAFCDHAIRTPGSLMEVPDATLDPRFADNPLVTGEPHIRFYAGMPLVTADGHALGTLCVIDHTPRQLDSAQREALARLARLVAALLAAARHRHETSVVAMVAGPVPRATGTVVAIVQLQDYAGRVARDGAAHVHALLRDLAKAVQQALPEAGVAMPSDTSFDVVAVGEHLKADHVSARLAPALLEFEQRTGTAVLHGVASGDGHSPMDQVFLQAEDALTRARSLRARVRAP